MNIVTHNWYALTLTVLLKKTVKSDKHSREEKKKSKNMRSMTNIGLESDMSVWDLTEPLPVGLDLRCDVGELLLKLSFGFIHQLTVLRHDLRLCLCRLHLQERQTIPRCELQTPDGTWWYITRVSGSIKLNTGSLLIYMYWVPPKHINIVRLRYLPWLLLCSDPQSCCASSPQRPGFGVSRSWSWIALHSLSRHAIFQALL